MPSRKNHETSTSSRKGSHHDKVSKETVNQILLALSKVCFNNGQKAIHTCLKKVMCEIDQISERRKASSSKKKNAH